MKLQEILSGICDAFHEYISQWYAHVAIMNEVAVHGLIPIFHSQFPFYRLRRISLLEPQSPVWVSQTKPSSNLPTRLTVANRQGELLRMHLVTASQCSPPLTSTVGDLVVYNSHIILCKQKYEFWYFVRCNLTSTLLEC